MYLFHIWSLRVDYYRNVVKMKFLYYIYHYVHLGIVVPSNMQISPACANKQSVIFGLYLLNNWKLVHSLCKLKFVNRFSSCAVQLISQSYLMVQPMSCDYCIF